MIIGIISDNLRKKKERKVDNVACVINSQLRQSSLDIKNKYNHSFLLLRQKVLSTQRSTLLDPLQSLCI